MNPRPPEPRRLRVLLSAYACEPGRGSEPEVGWQWALQMARFHDVTVLTRENNRQIIEEGLAGLGDSPRPAFVYFDLPVAAIRLKKRLGLHKSYYILWQHAVRKVVRRLVAERKFDLLHHITFATYRSTTAVWGFGIPCIWGPVGGIESVPASLLPWTHPKSLVLESLRNLDNWFERSVFPVLRARARRSNLVLATTRQMDETFRAMGVPSRLMPTVGLHVDKRPPEPREPSRGPLRLLYVGGLIALKGMDLLVEAIGLSETDARLTLVGEGDFRGHLEKLAGRLGLGSRVEFLGKLPRSEVLSLYADFDVLVFPSLHDTGGFAVLEAMVQSLPVICLAVGGPYIAVRNGAGICVPIGKRAEVVRGLAAAIRAYDGDRQRLVSDGKAAREAVLENYDWQKKGDAMRRLYDELLPPA